MSNSLKRPGGELATRPLHFIWITDCSGSMSGEKIAQLNTAIRNAIPSMRNVADENPNANVLVRALKFSNGAQWHVSQPTQVNDFEWIDLQADGLTDMGKAFMLLSDQLKIPPMSDRALPPVLVLLSDGQPTDDYSTPLKNLLELPWGKKAVKIAIAIGSDADLEVLQKFINNPEIKPLVAKNADTLTKYIKWASTAVLKSASSPNSNPQNGIAAATSNVAIPALPASGPIDVNETW